MQKEVYEFISKKTKDPIVEWKTCAISGQVFAVFQSDLDFYDKVSPVINGEKIQIPVPTLGPEERWRRRLLFKNERTLFKNTCGLTGKPIISIHAPDSGLEVYSVAAWRSDKWDPMSYGKDWDSSASFFDQFKDLYRKVPQIAMMNDNGIASQNIEYCQDVAYAKNCYLTSVAWKLEHAYYCDNMAGGNWLIDCFFSMDSENSYECCDSSHLYGCFRLQYAYNCQSCWFGFDLAGCKDCIGCVNLREQQYCIFNKQHTKEEYEKYKLEFFEKIHNDFDAFHDKFYDFVGQQIHRATYNTNASNTFGSSLNNSENARMSYNIKEVKDIKYCTFGDGMKDAMDLTVAGETNLCYESNTPDHSYKDCFTILSRSCRNVLYSDMCHSCQDCFGCVGLRNKQYCVFNKQYTKEDYETLVIQIINKMRAPSSAGKKDGERGEFFPKELTPLAYNISTVKDYFPLTKEEALSKGYTRRDTTEEINVPDGIESIQTKDLSHYSKDVPDDIIQKALICEVSGRPFRVLEPELKFYKKWNVPFPHKHPDLRFEERLKRMPEKKLYFRSCDKCSAEILTVRGADVKFEVYCDECYNKEVY